MNVETVIIGGGQAGLALSHSLTAAERPHVVLERGRVGERWRSERWESLRLLTPNWLNRLPGAPALPDPEAERILAMLEVRDWAKLTEPGTLASAKRLAAQGTWREALDAMLGALADDPDARRAMLEVFTVLGEDDEMVAEYRRKLAAALF